VAWARRLEQLLGKPAAKLPERRTLPTEPQTLGFMPYSDRAEKPEQKSLEKLGDSLRFDGGLSFKADKTGFSLAYTTTSGPPLEKDAFPGGTLDFRLYIQGEKPGDFIPYRFHCDFNPAWYGSQRAPARGREHSLFGTDERFRPFSLSYMAPNTRVWIWPRLRDYGPDYPKPEPSLTVAGNKNGGWTATLSFKWIDFYGVWPMQRDGKSDLWFVGLDRSPETGKTLAGRILWPRGGRTYFRMLASAMHPFDMTHVYSAELARTEKVWTTAQEERLYPYPKTERPSFNRYDAESDAMFWERLVEPLCRTNENAWKVIFASREHPSKLPLQPDRVKMAIWERFGSMCFLSHDVGLRRLAYLEDRFAGRTPPPAPSKKKSADEIAAEHDEPDADYNPDGLQLDEKEF